MFRAHRAGPGKDKRVGDWDSQAALRGKNSQRAAGYCRAAAADEIVKISTAVGLLHVIDIQPGPAPFARRPGRPPFLAAARERCLIHMQLQTAAGYVKLDLIPTFDKCQRAADC